MPSCKDTEFRERLGEALSCLPRRERQIFLAHCVDGYSYQEIAGRTGLSVRRVERHMASAIYRLAKLLDGRSLGWRERWFGGWPGVPFLRLFAAREERRRSLGGRRVRTVRTGSFGDRR